MAYQIKSSDPDLGTALRRIAESQLSAAITATRDENAAEAGIHEARKRCKKLRGLLRLVRSGFRDYHRENAAIRDAARLTSELRDCVALLETHDALMEAPGAARVDFAPVRGALTRARDETYRDGHLPETLAAQREALTKILARSADWEVTGRSADVIRTGLEKTWKRAVDEMPKRPAGARPEKIHEWRKRAKYHWHHAKLLRRIWPGPMTTYAEECDRFTEMLGGHHDLVTYEAFLSGDRAPRLTPDRMTELHRLVVARRDQLEREAWSLGARLFTPPVKSLPKTWERHWAIWRKGA